MSQDAAREWNAESYHRVSEPQTAWGRRVLSRLTLHGLAYSFCCDLDTACIILRQDDGELLPANPSYDIRLTEVLRKNRGYYSKDGVTCQITIAVVERFEVVDVGDCQSDWTVDSA